MHDETLDWLNHAPELMNAYLLVDNSACDGDWLSPRAEGKPRRRGPLVKRLERVHLPYEALWGRMADDEESAVAPILLQWREGEANGAFLNELLSMTQGRNALSMFCSPEPLQVVAERLRLRAHVSIMNDDYLLRFFDTRVLVELMPCLTPQQQMSFTAMSGGWRYRDRDDQWQSLNCSGFDPLDNDLPFELDDAQQNVALHIGSADRIESALARVLDENPLDSLAPGERYQWIKARQEDAMRHQVVEHSGQLHFCLNALQLGDDFHRDPQWQSAVAQLRTPQVMV